MEELVSEKYLLEFCTMTKLNAEIGFSGLVGSEGKEQIQCLFKCFELRQALMKQRQQRELKKMISKIETHQE